jgi:TetR/AcrR family transcriptional regulator
MVPRAHRSPRPGERRTDAERSRRLLLDAALEEFAAKGFAGARVQHIADRAGVNKQLITYHFGGKEGLYRALEQRWLYYEAEFDDHDVPVDELWLRLMGCVWADRGRAVRLYAWRGLTEDLDAVPPDEREDLTNIRARQERGELPADVDAEALSILLTAMVAAPVIMPLTIHRAYGLHPDSPEFRERWGEQLRRLASHLRAGPPAPE